MDLPDSVDCIPFAASGMLLPTEGGWIAKAQGFFQQPTLWLGHVPPAYPDIPVMTNGTLHPMRPPKPVGPVYSRFIPGWTRFSVFTSPHQKRICRISTVG